MCLRGTFQIGEGETFDAGKLQTLNPGAVWHIPAQMHYFAEAKDSAIILIYGEGPLFGLSEPESLSSFLHIRQFEEAAPNGRPGHRKAGGDVIVRLNRQRRAEGSGATASGRASASFGYWLHFHPRTPVR